MKNNLFLINLNPEMNESLSDLSGMYIILNINPNKIDNANESQYKKYISK